MLNGHALDDATPDGETFFEGGDGVYNWYDNNRNEIKTSRAK